MIRFSIAVASTLAVCAFGATVAQAAPQLELTDGGPPATLAPGGTGTGELTFTNTGDANVLSGSATITVELPVGLTAVATNFPFPEGGAPRWTGCSIEPTDKREIVCTGPIGPFYQIAAGSSQCALFGFLPPLEDCPIAITVKVDDGIPAGSSLETTIDACLGAGGTPPCTTASRSTLVRNFGDDFGFAPINQDGAETVEAIAGTKAFWAGACERTAAPAFGDPIPAPGFGTIPNTVWVPAGTDSNNPSNNRIQLPAPATNANCIDVGEATQYLTSEFAAMGIWFEEPAWRLPAAQQAGSHPDGSSTMAFARDPGGETDGAVDNIYVDLPPGFVGNPNAIEKCSQEEFAEKPTKCSAASQVGTLHLLIKGRLGHAGHGTNASHRIYPVWNLEPRHGRVAEIGFGYASGEDAVSVRLTAKARTNGDFGVTAFAGQIPAALEATMQTITIWGVPWEAANDIWRVPRAMAMHGSEPCMAPPAGAYVGYIPFTGYTIAGCAQSYDPSWGDIQPFISQETDCNTAPVVAGWIDSYQNPGGFTADGDPDPADSEFNASAANPGWKTATSDQAAVTGCEKLDFEPAVEFATTTNAADGATGLTVDLSVPQNNVPPFAPPAEDASQTVVDDYVDQATAHWKSDPGLATAHLKDTVVTMPPGVSVNPSAATGLTACDDATVGVRQQGNPPLFDNSDPADGLDGDDCPNGSKIGTARVETPLLDDPLTGDVILGTPKSTNPQSGQMFRMFIVLRDKDRGLVTKVYGSAVTNPATGQITATFENNPEVPFENLHLQFKGGSKGLLAMPQQCGTPAWAASFTPWSSVGAPVAVPDAPDGGVFAVDQRCGNGFSPALAAGMDTQTARSNGTFSFRFARSEGQQYLRGLTATLPPGLLASVKDLPLCSNAQAAAGACPASSKIGIVDAKAGSGDPFVLEQKGEVFLTVGYKGGEYGLAVKIRPIAGPFRGAMELSPIVVRQAIHVDRKTAQVTATSDPFPLIHHGVPLRVREVTVLVNRGGFMLNPSDCSAKQVGARLVSDQGAPAGVTNRFQASGCAALPFKPRLGLRLTGRKQTRTGRHPGIRALVRQNGVGEAGIQRAEVRLPKTLALDVDNAQALCEFEDGTKPDLENHCPKGSIVGRARAQSPLLNDDLAGNVYFVKNVRIDPDTGNEIRTLPMIVAALRGEIAVNLVGESDVEGGKLVNTFDEVPDAPISQFNMNIRGGKNGIVAVTRTRRSLINLCSAGRQVAEADMDGQNGKRHDFNVNMRKPCPRRRTAAQVCRKRTNTKPAMRRCVRRVKANRARAAKRKAAAKRNAAARRAKGGSRS